MSKIKNFLRRKTILKQVNYLELTPLRLAQEVIAESGEVAILIPRFTSKFAQKYFLPRHKSVHFQIKLDEFGAATWLAIDGEKNVSTIAQELLAKFGDKIQPIESRLTTFLTTLYEQKLITFAEIKEFM